MAAATGPSLTDQYVSQLATPFTGQSTRKLNAGDADVIPVGSGIHIEIIALLFTIFILVTLVTIVLGVIYNKYYQSKRNPYKGLTDDEQTALGEQFTYTDFQYASVVTSILGIVAAFIICAYAGRWATVYNPTLEKQNAIAQDIAVAMQGKKSVENVSNLLATSVHPLDNDKSAGERTKLSGTLQNGIKNGFRYEMNAERSKLGLDGDRFKTRSFMSTLDPRNLYRKQTV